jgi:hypothetical protein
VGTFPKRLVVADARGQGGSLRITKHPEQQKVVLSHWRDGVCVASTPVELSELPVIIAALAEALGDGLAQPIPAPSSRRRLLARLGVWFKPKVAQVVSLPSSGRASYSARPTVQVALSERRQLDA